MFFVRIVGDWEFRPMNAEYPTGDEPSRGKIMQAFEAYCAGNGISKD